jgi:hypothetical protein
MIDHRDFIPKRTGEGFFSWQSSYESLDAAVTAMNSWIESESVRVVNIETVVMPGISDEETESVSSAPGQFSSPWRQFIRVWFERS